MAQMRQLKNRAQFVRAARGRKISGRLLVLQCVKSETADAGIGFTVTKRQGNSPERNRIKRRLRAAISQSAAGFTINHDYVVIGRRAILTAKFDEIVGAVEKAVRKLTSTKPSHAVAG